MTLVVSGAVSCVSCESRVAVWVAILTGGAGRVGTTVVVARPTGSDDARNLSPAPARGRCRDQVPSVVLPKLPQRKPDAHGIRFAFRLGDHGLGV